MKDTWHVYPTGDFKEHIIEGNEICWCRPKIRFNFDDSKTIFHNSFDGREKKEKKIKPN